MPPITFPLPEEPEEPSIADPPPTPMSTPQRRLLAVVTAILAAGVVVAAPATLRDAHNLVRFVAVLGIVAAFVMLGIACTRRAATEAALAPVGLGLLAAVLALAWLLPSKAIGTMMIDVRGGEDVCGDAGGVRDGFLVVTVREPDPGAEKFTLVKRDVLLPLESIVAMRKVGGCD